MARPDDELVLLVKIRAGSRARQAPGDLTAELWRGNRLRDRWRQQVSWAAGACARAAFRLRWNEGPGSSPRLTCRVLLDGHEVLHRTVLLGQPAVDAQGRFQGGVPAGASPATLLAFARELEANLGPEDR
jgi:hypothetical protein